MPAIISMLLVLAAAAPIKAAAPARHSPTVADSVRAAIEKDRSDTRDWLKSAPTSYLATVQRVDFLDRTQLEVGRSETSHVRIDDPAIRPHHLRVTVAGDSFRVEALDDSASFKVRGTEMRSATVGPSSVAVGRYTVRFSHQRFPAIIVFDPQSPRYKMYKGIEYFPIDLAWRYELRLTPNPKPDTIVILSTRSSPRRAVRAGWFDFTAQGKRCRLEASRLLEPGVGESDLAVFFRDATTGKDSYPIGRYIDPVRLPDGRYVLDFNMAYNPACAYSDHYNCPIPPRGNRLKVAVTAGEKDSHYLEHAAGP